MTRKRFELNKNILTTVIIDKINRAGSALHAVCQRFAVYWPVEADPTQDRSCPEMHLGSIKTKVNTKVTLPSPLNHLNNKTNYHHKSLLVQCKAIEVNCSRQTSKLMYKAISKRNRNRRRNVASVLSFESLMCERNKSRYVALSNSCGEFHIEPRGITFDM